MSKELNPCPNCGHDIEAHEKSLAFATCCNCALSREEAELIIERNALRKQLEDMTTAAEYNADLFDCMKIERDALRDQLGAAMKALDYYATHLLEGGRVAVEAQAEIAKIGETK